jgi:hypothetical protein
MRFETFVGVGAGDSSEVAKQNPLSQIFDLTEADLCLKLEMHLELLGVMKLS